MLASAFRGHSRGQLHDLREVLTVLEGASLLAHSQTRTIAFNGALDFFLKNSSRATELTSRGAAIIGFEQLGVPAHSGGPGNKGPGTKAPGTAPAISRVFHPDARSHAVYREAAARQQKLLRAVLT